MSVVIRFEECAPGPPPMPSLTASASSSIPHAYSLRVATRWQDLARQVAAWDELADNALEPNPFYSATGVLAAMRHLQPHGEPCFLIVSASSPDPGLPDQWHGFFPFVRFRTYRGIWIDNLRLLAHDYCFLRVPLVRADCAPDVIRLAFDWLERSGAAIVELGDQTGEGAYARALEPLLARRGDAWLASSHARALFIPADNEETFLRQSVSHGRLKELRRQQRRLAEKGALRFEEISDPTRIDAGIGEFLALEQSGWKGPQGTAMACRSGHRAFFSELVRQAWRSQRLRMTALRLGERVIAMKCNFMAAPGGFAFKIAYDESFSQYSPGVLLELENIRRMHAEPNLKWMDSCAAPGHPMIEHLWKERRPIQNWVVPLNLRGRLAIATLALAQRVRRALSSWLRKARTARPAPR